jgi:hypothetical protein
MTTVLRKLFLPASLLLIAVLLLPVVYRSFITDRITWAVSDALINYQAGFVRRGLLGELIYQLATATGISPLRLIAGFFFVTTVLTVTGFVLLLRPYFRRFPLATALVLFSPALLMFPIHDYWSYARKESFVVIGLLLHALVARRFSAGGISAGGMTRFYLLVLLPYLTLCMFIHEVQLFFLAAHLGILFLAARQRHLPYVRLLLILAVPVAVALVLMMFPGDGSMITPIIHSWRPMVEIPEDQKYNAIQALGWDLQSYLNLSAAIASDPKSLALYLLAAVLGVVVPVAVMVPLVTRTALHPDPSLRRRLIVFTVLIVLSTIPLFILGADYGRWIHLMAFSAVCLVLSIPLSGDTPPRRVPAWVALPLCAVLIFGWELPHFASVGKTPEVIKSGMAGSLFRSAKFLTGQLGSPWTRDPKDRSTRPDPPTTSRS